MSSKKVSSKETKPAAKKASAKKAEKAPAKKAASAPKKTAAASAKSAAKPAKAPAKAAKPAKAASKAQKAEPKKVAPKASKPAAKKVEKAPAKKPAKVVAKPAAKPAAKKAEKAPAKPAKAVKAATKPVQKQAAKATSKTETKKASMASKVKEETKKVVTPEVTADDKPKKPKGGKSAPETVPEVVEPKPEASGKKPSDKPSKPGKVVDYDPALLLEGVKKLSKTVMFTEVDEQEDRSNKKKMSSEMKNLEMKPTSAIRHKVSLAEETQEELTERILKELEEQNLAFEREAATQMCTRCNRNLVSPEFWVDKHLGYCEECAAILKLGQSKEARKVEYQLNSMGGDSLEEEDDEIMGPNDEDLKEAEEDLADMGE